MVLMLHCQLETRVECVKEWEGLTHGEVPENEEERDDVERDRLHLYQL